MEAAWHNAFHSTFRFHRLLPSPFLTLVLNHGQKGDRGRNLADDALDFAVDLFFALVRDAKEKERGKSGDQQ